MAEFIPGQQLCLDFYREVVAPRVRVPHSAGLLGPGSDVLGYDTPRSTDHDWGPRCTVFVAAPALDDVRRRVLEDLPESHRGWPLRIGRDGRPPAPHVDVETLPGWLCDQTGFESWPREPTAADWLTLPQQRLLGITQGAVFADDDGSLAALRRLLAWYPDPVWWWLLACQWRRLAQDEPLVQRTAEVGDELGSRVLAARIVRECMRLALLIARRYAPYGKWVGTAFANLPDPDGLAATLQAAAEARALPEREQALGAACSLLGRRFNALAPHLDVDVSVRGFFDRPARVLGADRFAAAALGEVADTALAALPLVGSVDQMLDCTDVLASPARTAAMRAYYRGLGAR